jgi:DNA-directed RNA polymerase specialized sigma24 family protein
MPTDQTPPENFELLLAWLGANRDKGAEKYEQIRRNLIDYFRRRDVFDPISLTDEVISRVTGKVHEVATDFVGEPSAYFFGVARRVLAEWRRCPKEKDLPEYITAESDEEAAQRKELTLQSLERCWKRLSREEQQILFRYCVETPPEKLSESREQLARELGVSLNALRVMSHRLRRKVKSCIERLIEVK